MFRSDPQYKGRFHRSEPCIEMGVKVLTKTVDT